MTIIETVKIVTACTILYAIPFLLLLGGLLFTAALVIIDTWKSR